MNNLPSNLGACTLSDLTNLIEVRNYVVNAVNNFNLPKEQSHELNKMLVLIDRRIVTLILCEDFKKLLEYQDIDKVVGEAARNNNIKLGMKPQQ